jgi:colicin import membrane protein
MLNLSTVQLEGVEKSKATQIRDTFEPMVKMLESFESEYDKIIKQSIEKIDSDLCKKAGDVRKKIAKIRTEAEKIRKAQKDEYLRAGKAIDGVSNILKWAIVEKEDELKKIENYFEEMERKRKQELQEQRALILCEFCQDANEKHLSDMDEDVWQAFLTGKKKDYEDRIEAERIAEEDRLAQIQKQNEEQERIRLENEMLKEQLAKEKLEQEAREAQAIEIARKEKEIQDERIAKEKEKVRIAEEKYKEQLAKEKAIEEERQSKLSAGDSEKVVFLINDLEELKTKYSFESDKNKKMIYDVQILLEKIITHIKK